MGECWECSKLSSNSKTSFEQIEVKGKFSYINIRPSILNSGQALLKHPAFWIKNISERINGCYLDVTTWPMFFFCLHQFSVIFAVRIANNSNNKCHKEPIKFTCPSRPWAAYLLVETCRSHRNSHIYRNLGNKLLRNWIIIELCLWGLRGKPQGSQTIPTQS